MKPVPPGIWQQNQHCKQAGAATSVHFFCEPCRCRLYPAVLLANFVSHINEFGRKGICRVVCWGTRDEKMFVLRV